MLQGRPVVSEKKSIKDYNEEEVRALLSYEKDKKARIRFSKINAVLRNTDVALDLKKKVVMDFNTDYQNKYEIESVFFFENNRHQVSVKLIDFNTKQELESGTSDLISFSEAKKIKDSFNAVVMLSQSATLSELQEMQKKIDSANKPAATCYSKFRDTLFGGGKWVASSVRDVATAAYTYATKRHKM